MKDIIHIIKDLDINKAYEDNLALVREQDSSITQLLISIKIGLVYCIKEIEANNIKA